MKKSIVFISVSLVLVILLGIGVSYSMWNISVSQDTTNVAESKCFDLSISNQANSISLENAYPISNDKGKSLTPFTFTVTNTCDITAEYSVNLEVLKDSTLSSKFIDVMLENNDIREINLLGNFESTDKANSSSIESRKLITGILKSNESQNYSLRLWIDYDTTLEDLNNEIKTFNSKIVVIGKPINFNYEGNLVFNFDYTGDEQTFTAPVSGTYRLETWGAQGGDATEKFVGGYGGYSSGNIYLDSNQTVYINVGSVGENCLSDSECDGGYNGGGSAKAYNYEYSRAAGGGGATHIANKSGLLNTFENDISNLLIVSGGGGGGNYTNDVNGGIGGTAGGYIGSGPTNLLKDNHSARVSNGGSQSKAGCNNLSSDCGSFGQGGNSSTTQFHNGSGSGGGAGYYGGSGANIGSGAGGSGYIANSSLKNKSMYCYNCKESNEESTKTISTTCSEETPTTNCAKKGNGYARITLVSIDE